MSRFVKFSSHKFELGAGEFGPEWVEIRDELSYYEGRKLNGMLFNMEYKDGESVMKSNPSSYYTSILESYVCGWQMFDEEGNVVPFSRDLLARLDDATCMPIVQHIEAYKQELEDRKNSPAMTTPPVIGEKQK